MKDIVTDPATYAVASQPVRATAGKPLRRCSASGCRANERRSLVLATIESVVALGADGLRARHVAGEAGVPPSVVQRHFPTTAHLAAAALGHVVDQLAAAVEQGGPAPARLEESLDSLAYLISERPALFLVFAELELRGRRDPLIRAAVEQAEERWRAALASLFDGDADSAARAAALVATVAKGVKFDGAEAVGLVLEHLRRLLAEAADG